MEDKLNEIGSLIRQARKEKNLSQSDLADLIQISISHMSDIENGKKKIGIDIFMKITEALDVSADWLLRTNTSNVKSIQNHEALDVLTDCTTQETEVILKLMKEITLAINKGDTWKYKLARWLVR